MDNRRITLIDIWITVLTVLVIIGHCYFVFSPLWYIKIHQWIYSFHMGAFFFVTGFLVSYNYRRLNSLRDYWQYIYKRLIKFGVPFVILGSILSIVSIYLKGGVLEDYIIALKMFFLETMSSQVIYLWFIAVLLLFYLIAPLVCQYYKYFIVPMLLISLLLYFHPLTRFFSLHCFSTYLFFFILGVVINKHINILKRIPIWISYMFFIPFSWVSVYKLGEVPYLISCLLSLPCLLGICIIFNKFKKITNLFHLISINCFSIYLHQMIFINILAIVIMKFHFKMNFIFFILIGIITSIMGSVLLNLLWIKFYNSKKGVKIYENNVGN